MPTSDCCFPIPRSINAESQKNVDYHTDEDRFRSVVAAFIPIGKGGFFRCQHGLLTKSGESFRYLISPAVSLLAECSDKGRGPSAVESLDFSAHSRDSAKILERFAQVGVIDTLAGVMLDADFIESSFDLLQISPPFGTICRGSQDHLLHRDKHLSFNRKFISRQSLPGCRRILTRTLPTPLRQPFLMPESGKCAERIIHDSGVYTDGRDICSPCSSNLPDSKKHQSN
jgi:hypothetical protein